MNRTTIPRIVKKLPQVRFSSNNNVIKLGKPAGPKHSGCGEDENQCSLDGDCKTVKTTCSGCCNLSSPSPPKKTNFVEDCLVPPCDFKPFRTARPKKYPGECFDPAKEAFKSFCQTVPQLSGATSIKNTGCCRPSAKELQKQLDKVGPK